MKKAAKLLGVKAPTITLSALIGLALVAACLTLVAAPAGAAPPTGTMCKDKVFVGTGSGAKEDAIASAIADWEKRVASEFGSKWAKWGSARDKTTKVSVKDASIKLYKARITGKPCLWMKLEKAKPGGPAAKKLRR
jgi:hypothetical protein